MHVIAKSNVFNGLIYFLNRHRFLISCQISCIVILIICTENIRYSQRINIVKVWNVTQVGIVEGVKRQNTRVSSDALYGSMECPLHPPAINLQIQGQTVHAGVVEYCSLSLSHSLLRPIYIGKNQN